MRVLYLDCFAGMSGDMFISSLINAGLNRDLLIKELNKLNLGKKIDIKIKNVKVNGISANQFIVMEDDKERSLGELTSIINKSSLDKEAKVQAIKMLNRLHSAEKKIHKKFDHFHELGLYDTIIDIVSAIIGIKLLNIDKVYASKVNTGSGFINTHHGKMPVPAPATLELLKGIPIYTDGTKFELTTPTGALLLSEFVDEFIMPLMKVESIGYGAGTAKIDNFLNVLRAMIGETYPVSSKEKPASSQKALIETNIDDMNPQIYEYVMEKLFQKGARDVYMTPVYMKKNRPGIILSCICDEKDKEKIIETILKETTSIGLRIFYPERVEMIREKISVNTGYGKIEVKVSRYDKGIINISPEFESCKKAAQKSGIPLKDICHTARVKAGKLLRN